MGVLMRPFRMEGSLVNVYAIKELSNIELFGFTDVLGRCIKIIGN